MLLKRPSHERGFADHGWLRSHHSFSFADYFDPAHMHFRALRVLNEDDIAAGRGFGAHAHENMEILTCVVSGALAHRDSLGTGSIIKPGDVQRMYAGTGVTHSEFNASKIDPVHLFQIWITPTQLDGPPSYSQQTFEKAAQRGRLVCFASPDGRSDSLQIHADCCLMRGLLAPRQRIDVPFGKRRALWVQVITGALNIDGTALAAGDGAAITSQNTAQIEAIDDSDLLVFDLA